MKKFKVDTSVSLVLTEQEKKKFKPQMVSFDKSNKNQMQYNLNRLCLELWETGRLQIPLRGKSFDTHVDIYQSLYFRLANVPTQTVTSMNPETGRQESKVIESHDRILVWDEYNTHPHFGTDVKIAIESTLTKWGIKTFEPSKKVKDSSWADGFTSSVEV